MILLSSRITISVNKDVNIYLRNHPRHIWYTYWFDRDGWDVFKGQFILRFSNVNVIR